VLKVLPRLALVLRCKCLRFNVMAGSRGFGSRPTLTALRTAAGCATKTRLWFRKNSAPRQSDRPQTHLLQSVHEPHSIHALLIGLRVIHRAVQSIK
jgi:hypothetical protein